MCAGACASVYCTSPKSSVRCEPTKALCFCVLYEPKELCAVRAYKGFVPLCTVRASRALCGASLQRLYIVCARACASVYRTSLTSFVRCEPTKALYSVLVLAPPGFAPSAHVLVRSDEQMSSCTRTCTYVLYELTRYLCFCIGTCMPVCRGTKHSRGTSTPACVMRTPAVKNYIIGTVVKI